MKGSDTINSIQRMNVPIGKKTTYVRFCCDIWLQIDDINGTRLTVGGDRLEFDGKTSTETAKLETIKTHLNSKISTKDTKYPAANMRNFYLISKIRIIRIYENSPQPNPTRNHR